MLVGIDAGKGGEKQSTTMDGDGGPRTGNEGGEEGATGRPKNIGAPVREHTRGNQNVWANRPSFASLLRPAPTNKQNLSNELNFIPP